MTKVIIFGGGSKYRYFKDEKGALLWSCNGQFIGSLRWLPRVDAAFNLHRFELLKQYGYSFDGEHDWIKENPTVPFYTMDKWPKYLVPNYCNQKMFPWIQMATGKNKLPRPMYHCGSFDWMVAFAIFNAVAMQIDKIELHGINLCLEGSEPMASQACLEYWCGYAEAKGIAVSAAADSTLFCYIHKTLTNRVYGIDDAPIYEDKRKDGMPAYDYLP